MMKDLNKDTQTDLRKGLKNLGAADVRTDLNKFNEVGSSHTHTHTLTLEIY